MIIDLAKQGTTILFSTHLMDHVEKLLLARDHLERGKCDRQGIVGPTLRTTYGQAEIEGIFLKLTARPVQNMTGERARPPGFLVDRWSAPGEFREREPSAEPGASGRLFSQAHPPGRRRLAAG